MKILIVFFLITSFASTNVFPYGSETKISCMNGMTDIFGFIRAPNCSGVDYYCGTSFKFTSNEYGLRAKNYPPYSDSKTIRVIVFGASLMMAPTLEYNEMPTTLTENKVRQKLKYNKIEIINTSRDDSHGLHNSILLEKYLNAYHPDIILYVGGDGHFAKDWIRSATALYNSDGSYKNLSPIIFTHKSLPKWMILNYPWFWKVMPVLSSQINGAYDGVVALINRYKLWFTDSILRERVKALEQFSDPGLKAMNIIFRLAKENGVPLVFTRIKSDVPALPFNGVLNGVYGFFRALGPEIVFKSEEFDFIYKKFSTSVHEFQYLHSEMHGLGMTVCDHVHLNRAGSELLSDHFAKILLPVVKEKILQKQKGFSKKNKNMANL